MHLPPRSPRQRHTLLEERGPAHRAARVAVGFTLTLLCLGGLALLVWQALE